LSYALAAGRGDAPLVCLRRVRHPLPERDTRLAWPLTAAFADAIVRAITQRSRSVTAHWVSWRRLAQTHRWARPSQLGPLPAG